MKSGFLDSGGRRGGKRKKDETKEMSVAKVTVTGTKENVVATSTPANSDVDLGQFPTLSEALGRKKKFEFVRG